MKNSLKIIFLLVILFYNNLFAINKVGENNLEKTILQLEWKHQFEFAGFYTAIEKGYYKDIGIDLEIKEFEENINISEDEIFNKELENNFKEAFGILLKYYDKHYLKGLHNRNADKNLITIIQTEKVSTKENLELLKKYL